MIAGKWFTPVRQYPDQPSVRKVGLHLLLRQIEQPEVCQEARSELRASVFGARYVVTCLVFASAIPVIAWIHHTAGFDVLFRVLSVVAIAMIGMILLLPGRLPDPNAVPKGAGAATV